MPLASTGRRLLAVAAVLPVPLLASACGSDAADAFDKYKHHPCALLGQDNRSDLGLGRGEKFEFDKGKEPTCVWRSPRSLVVAMNSSDLKHLSREKGMRKTRIGGYPAVWRDTNYGCIFDVTIDSRRSIETAVHYNSLTIRNTCPTGRRATKMVIRRLDG